jgi:hypothetical protein
MGTLLVCGLPFAGPAIAMHAIGGPDRSSAVGDSLAARVAGAGVAKPLIIR